MHVRLPLGIALLVSLLILATAARVEAAPRLRKYQGGTSQMYPITILVGKTSEGRFVREIRLRYNMTCEDQSTQPWGYGKRFGPAQVPITDGAFSYDSVTQFLDLHVAGDLGRLDGSGTGSVTLPALTPDGQAQLCATGDLTWTVEFVRTL